MDNTVKIDPIERVRLEPIAMKFYISEETRARIEEAERTGNFNLLVGGFVLEPITDATANLEEREANWKTTERVLSNYLAARRRMQ